MTDSKQATPSAWTKGAIRTHLGAAEQTFTRLRGEMLDTVGPGGDQASLGAALVRLADAIRVETAWLESLQPLPPDMRVRPRALYLATYGEQLVRCAKTLSEAAQPPTRPDRFEAFGIALLQLLAHLRTYRERV